MARKKTKKTNKSTKSDSPARSRGQHRSEPELVSGLIDWATLWQTFLAAHGPWWDRHQATGPAYALPEPVVRRLGEAQSYKDTQHRTRHALLSEDDVATEMAFGEACAKFGTSTVGVYNGRPIQFSLLGSPPPPMSTSVLMEQLGWDRILLRAAGVSDLQRAHEQTDQARHRLLGFAGYLTFDKQYQLEKRPLQERWAALDVQPLFPFRANIHDQPPSFALGARRQGTRLPETTSTFLDDLGAFLRKWQLIELTTWDLPWPQGPLGSIPVDLARRLLGPTQNVSTLPAYYEVPSSVDVREETRMQQQMAAEHHGLQGKFPVKGLVGRDQGHRTAEAAFRLWLVEKTVRDRYGNLWGGTATLLLAFGEVLKCSEERVKQIRKVYLPFLPRPSAS